MLFHFFQYLTSLVDVIEQFNKPAPANLDHCSNTPAKRFIIRIPGSHNKFILWFDPKHYHHCNGFNIIPGS